MTLTTTPVTGNRKIQHQTIAKALVTAIRDRILSGELREGTQLRQDSLANEHGVSRIPVREALVQLESEGFIVYSRHKGAVVKPLSLDELGEIFELRLQIEPLVIKYAIQNWNSEAAEDARQALDAFNHAVETNTSIAAWGELNWRFHEAISLPSKREHSLRIMQNLHRLSSRYVITQLMVATKGLEKAKEEHSALLDYCQRGEKTKAAALLKNHIKGTQAQLIEYLHHD